MYISFDNLSKKYYKKPHLSYYGFEIFDIVDCRSITYKNQGYPFISIHGQIEHSPTNLFVISGWTVMISKKYLRLFS